MSKGSSPRPFSVSNQEYADRWDAIFAKKSKADVCPHCGSDDTYFTHTSEDDNGNRVDYQSCNECEHDWDHT